MITNVKAIYQGDGILRLLDVPQDLAVDQQVQVDILTDEPDFEWDEPYNPSAEAVWNAMGRLEIRDRALAEWLAFSPEVGEQNQFLYETSDGSAT